MMGTEKVIELPAGRLAPMGGKTVNRVRRPARRAGTMVERAA